MNNCNFIGRLTKDPELKTTSSGKSFVRFALAVSRGKVKEGQQEADFIPCIAWNKTAEILANYCKKGQTIGIIGRFTTTPYEANGEKKTGYDIMVNSLDFLGGKTESKPQESAPAPSPAPSPAPEAPSVQINDGEIDDDPFNDLPFPI